MNSSLSDTHNNAFEDIFADFQRTTESIRKKQQEMFKQPKIFVAKPIFKPQFKTMDEQLMKMVDSLTNPNFTSAKSKGETSAVQQNEAPLISKLSIKRKLLSTAKQEPVAVEEQSKDPKLDAQMTTIDSIIRKLQENSYAIQKQQSKAKKINFKPQVSDSKTKESTHKEQLNYQISQLKVDRQSPTSDDKTIKMVASATLRSGIIEAAEEVNQSLHNFTKFLEVNRVEEIEEEIPEELVHSEGEAK